METRWIVDVVWGPRSRFVTPILSAGWGVSSARPNLQATTPIRTLGGAAGHLRALDKNPCWERVLYLGGIGGCQSISFP